MGGAAVVEVVAIDRGDDDVGEAQLGGGFADMGGLGGVERPGQAGLDVAEGAGAGAGVAHDHESGVLLVPALAHIGAARLFADRDQLVGLDDGVGLGPTRRSGRLDADPVGLAGDWLVRLVRLFGVARALLILLARIGIEKVEDDGHGAVPETISAIT